MGVFIDTGVFVAARNKSDANYSRSVRLMQRALEGAYGRVYTSDYVIDEAITTALARTHNLDVSINTGKFIIESLRITKLRVGERDFAKAWEKYKELRKPISFTDATTLVLVEENSISKIMSFDSDFDGLIERVS
ncbi:MAG: type II toxin-antitoxin system VapC family toxin [Thaumarchaeota archaeon]|nr:type II toxin-antitoxin system VapC family toxin [Nitrososphaerota archaeon]